MAVTIGTTGTFQGTGTSTSVTVDSGSNRVFVACFRGIDASAANNPSPPITLDGTAATYILQDQDHTTAILTVVTALWVESDLPASGSKSIAWTGSGGENELCYLNAANVNPSYDFGANDTTLETGNTETISIDVSAATTGDLVIGYGSQDWSGTTTKSATTGTLEVQSDAIFIASGTAGAGNEIVVDFGGFVEKVGGGVALPAFEITSVSSDDVIGATENPWTIAGSGFGTQ